MAQTAQVLEELLGELEISDFARTWIDKSSADEDSIRQVYALLRGYGISDEKIASQAHLLGRNPASIRKNYQHHVGLLRRDNSNRNSGRDLLFGKASLLGIPAQTIMANVQYLHSIGIGYNNGPLLGTRPSTKRRKLVWILRELFDYRQAPQEQKRRVIERAYEFVRDNPKTLVSAITTLERSRDRLREKAQVYR